MQKSRPATKSDVKVSVVIPCYNQGQWLWEAIESVLAQDLVEYEIIVVNDGSTDPVTNRIVDEIDHSKVRVIVTENQGLAAARNVGIEQANGDYIFPLDSDDRIHPTYLSKAAAILDTHQDIGIVYCKAELFGEEQGIWDLEPYSFPEVLLSPQIFASSLYRKSDWVRSGGYQTDMIYGWEDYDFWLSLIQLGVQVHRIDEVLFYYRKTAGSMAGLDRKRMLYSFRKLFEHHRELYEANIGKLFEAVIDSKHVRDLNKLAQSDLFEIFVPDDDGYGSRNAREQHYPEGVWTKVSIFLNHVPEAGIHLLRLDPSRKVSVIDIESIKLLNAGTNAIVWEANLGNGGFENFVLGQHTIRIPHERCLRLFCSNTDGHFFLPSIDREILEQPLVLEVWMQRHPDLSEVAEFCERKVDASVVESKCATLKAQIQAHVVQSEELQAELGRQQEHATELEKIRSALENRQEVFKSESDQAKLLSETLKSELRQEQEKSRLLEEKLFSIENQLSEMKAKKRPLFGGK